MGNKNSLADAKFKAKEWQWQLKTEVKHMDREIKKIQTEEAKLQKEIHANAEKGNVQAVQMLAKSVVKSRKAVRQLEKTKANMHAVCLQLTTSISTMSTASSLKISADVMAKMNKIAKLDSVSDTMEQMRKEMARCAEAEGAVDEALRDSDEEEEASLEVQKVLEEMALDAMGPLAKPAQTTAAVNVVEEAPAAPVEAAKPARVAVAAGAPVSPPPQAPASTPVQANAPAASSTSEPTVQPTAQMQTPQTQPPDTIQFAAPTPSPPAVQMNPNVAPAPSAATAPSIQQGANSNTTSPPAQKGGSDLNDDIMRRLEALKK